MDHISKFIFRQRTTEEERDQNLSTIKSILESDRMGAERSHDFHRPVFIQPTFYLTIYTHIGRPIARNKKGYVLDIDTSTFAITDGTSRRAEDPPIGKRN